MATEKFKDFVLGQPVASATTSADALALVKSLGGGNFETKQLPADHYLTSNQTITLTGDVTGSGTTGIATTLATVNPNVGTFQGLTINGKGLVTAAVDQGYGTGSVTSVGLTSSDLTVGGAASPITVSGTFTLALPNVATAGTGTKATVTAKGLVTSVAQAVLASSDFANQGTTTTVLHGNAAGNPSFGAVSLSGDVTGNLPVGNLNSGTSAGGTTFWRGDGTWAVPAGTSTGTVTSVAASVPSVLTISGSPITTSGTLAFDLATQTANKVFAGPTTGAAAAPTFRALVTADLPAGTGTLTSVTFSGGLTASTNPIVATGTASTNLPIVTHSGGVTLSTRGQFEQFTGSSAATFTLTGDSAGWWVITDHQGTGSTGANKKLTLSPSSGTIDGQSTSVVYPGDQRIIQFDGTNYTSYLLRGGFIEIGTADSPFTLAIPTAIAYGEVELLGGGASGGAGIVGAGSANRRPGTGGGGGAYVPAKFTASALGTSQTVTIAAAQTTVGTGSGGNGSVGGNSTFGSLLTAYGGGAGAGGVTANSNTGGVGGGVLAVGTAGSNAGANVAGSAPAGSAGGTTVIGGHFGGAAAGAGGAGSAGGWAGGGGGGGATTTDGVAGGSSLRGGPGGGGGGGIGTGNAARAGGTGGSAAGENGGGTSGGSAGTTGVNGGSPGPASLTSTALGPGLGGGGGGGGFDNTGGGTASNGGTGGNGGIAAGGGGGGSAFTGKTVGNGGQGGPGLCRFRYGP